MLNMFRFGFTVVLMLCMSTLVAANSFADSKGKVGKKSTASVTPMRTANDTLTKIVDSMRLPAPLGHHVVAYYFHGNVRCATCLKLEAYSKEAIDRAFGDALKAGSLDWQVVNTDSTQNEHYLEDYQLFTKSIILSDMHNGKQTRWKNLDKIWELVGNKAQFHAYIQDEVRMFLDTTK